MKNIFSLLLTVLLCTVYFGVSAQQDSTDAKSRKSADQDLQCPPAYLPTMESIEEQMDYVVGASMLVSVDFLQEVGLMNEDYFLYFEEIDWAMRSSGRYCLCYAPDSYVYHKVGGSIGTSSHPASKSQLCDYYTLRNRLVFTRKYYSYALPAIYLGLCGAFGLRLLFGQWQKARMVLALIFGRAAYRNGRKVA